MKWSTVTAMPPGLTLAPDGRISGTPTAKAEGTAYVVVSVTDAVGSKSSGTVSILIDPVSVVTRPPLPGCTACIVRDWGANTLGQLGNGSTTDSAVPVSVPGLTGVTSIAGGIDNGYALKSDGSVWAWGDNRNGQLGNGTTTSSNIPVQVTGLTGATAIGSGGNGAYAVAANGTVWAWGFGDTGSAFGRLGNGTKTGSTTPVQVTGLTGVTAVSGGIAGGYALKSDGTVWAWGENGSGQLGNGTTTGSNIPVKVSGLAGVTAVSGGNVGAYALRSDGTVWAWGDGAFGQLGNGAATGSNIPVKVSVAGVTAITAGNYDGYALKSDGTVWAWGDGYFGQLGNGTAATFKSTPVKVSVLTGVIAIAAGSGAGYALKSDGTVWAWGGGASGRLGNGKPLIVRRQFR